MRNPLHGVLEVSGWGRCSIGNGEGVMLCVCLHSSYPILGEGQDKQFSIDGRGQAFRP